MLAYLMLIALGACAASLVWLAVQPALARRIDRLARRRIEAALPMSVAEFAGERDRLRAALAVRETLIEKRAEALSTEHARMLSDVGRRDARIHDLDDRLGDETARHVDTVTELNRVNTVLAGTAAALDAERNEHEGARDGLASLEGTHAILVKSHETLVDAADQMRAEGTALRAERETLLAQIENHEAVQRTVRDEHEALTRAAEARLSRAREALRQRDASLTEAEARASETATRLAASDTHGRALARDLAEARERLETLGALHQELTRRHEAAVAEALERDERVGALERDLGEARQRAEALERAGLVPNSEAGEEAAAASARERKQALDLEDARDRLARQATAREDEVMTLRRHLEEARAERESLQAEIARLVSRLAQGAASDARGRDDLLGMIEHLADDIAQASGVTLPAVTPRPRAAPEPARAAAE